MKFQPSNLTYALLTGVFLNSAVVIAEENIETIVISGTKTAKLLSDSPVSVDVIEGETIDLITKGTLADILTHLPGVLVTRSKKDGYNVSMRGFDSKHVLILVNGQPLATPSDSAVDLDQISASDIAQVEIMRGAASVMYGSAAMGGVINIITNRDDGDKAVFTYELGSYGNNAIASQNLSHLYKANLGVDVADWYHSLKLQFIDDSGFDYDEDNAQQNAAGIEKTFINYSTFSQIGDLDTTFAYQYFDELKERVTARVGGNVDLVKKSDVNQHQFDLNLYQQQQEWKVNGRYILHDEISGQSGSLRNAEIKLVEIDGVKVWQSGHNSPKHKGEAGSETVVGFLTHYDYLNQFKLATGSSNEKSEIDKESRQSIEAYAQYNYFTKDIQLLAGIRAQDDSDFGSHSAIQVDGMLDFEPEGYSIQVRFGFGQGYRVPDLKERHYIFDHSNLGYMVIGGDVALSEVFSDEIFKGDAFATNAIVPEESDTLSASLNLKTSVLNELGNYRFAISFHASDTENLITTIEDAVASKETGLIISRYANIAQSSIRGFDISNEFAFDDWALAFDYGYLHIEDTDGNRLSGKPKHQLKTRLSYDFSNYDMSTMLLITYQADETVPNSYVGEAVNGFALVDFKLNQAITERLDWHLSLNNIFDEHQSQESLENLEFDPRPVSSRELRLGVTYQF